jgi:uncharacterized integral membrane protein
MTRAIALFAALVLVGLFALLNWNAFAAPTPLSLGIVTVEAPLGLVMLGVVVFLSLLFTVWAISLQASALTEARRQTKELQAQRELADKAEASRFTELRAVLMSEVANVVQVHNETRALVIHRMDRLQDATRVSLEETSNTVSAYMGGLEDRLEDAQVLTQGRSREDALSVR